jgi:uncharacterized radical SAM superfamily Fe-S cluster-containing enzyme
MNPGRNTTESLCPVCLRCLPAERVSCGEAVELVKTCPDHGTFRAVVWQGRPGLEAWRRPKMPLPVRPELKPSSRGCPFDCGLCREHRQRTCTVLLEVTRRCNLCCPVCFADAGASGPGDPPLEEIREWFAAARGMAAGSNIQLSGGEPTLRDDLPEIVAAGREAGFGFIQLNTNGIRLAQEERFVAALKHAGLASVFLQYDGTVDAVHLALRGRALAEVKGRAVAACGRHGIGVVLVPTLVPGVNTRGVGELLKAAVRMAPVVRGVHFQPVAYFGRHPRSPGGGPRISLPELMAAIEDQTAGMFQASEFRPPGCEHAWCSFHAQYLVLPGGGVRWLKPSEAPRGCCAPIAAETGALRTMAHVARQWAAPAGLQPSGAPEPPASGPMSLEAFLGRARSHTFSVSAMAFQDVWTLDLERLRECCIHVLDPRHGLVPFCAYNVTAADGRSLYRR